jgi:hypothetical protein
MQNWKKDKLTNMKYHVFFTAQYIDPCLRNGRFGATSVNSLVNVKNGDIAFLFDGLKRKLFGPLKIISDNQFYENEAIYGRNGRNVVNYPNRVAFDNQGLKSLELNKLFTFETESRTENYLVNRTILSVIIANKQVHSTPLTDKEGKYLESLIGQIGNDIIINADILTFIDRETVLHKVINNRKPKSEAIFEMLLMLRNPSPIHVANQESVIYNQFILGLQRQIDILTITENEIKVIEIKKRDNQTNPYTQVIEYLDYVNSDFRLQTDNYRERQSRAIVLLEEGNRFLDRNQIPVFENLEVYSFNCDRDYEITINNFA